MSGDELAYPNMRMSLMLPMTTPLGPDMTFACPAPPPTRKRAPNHRLARMSR